MYSKYILSLKYQNILRTFSKNRVISCFMTSLKIYLYARNRIHNQSRQED